MRRQGRIILFWLFARAAIKTADHRCPSSSTAASFRKLRPRLGYQKEMPREHDSSRYFEKDSTGLMLHVRCLCSEYSSLFTSAWFCQGTCELGAGVGYGKQ